MDSNFVAVEEGVMDEWLLMSNLKILKNFTVISVPLILASLAYSANATITIFFVSRLNDPILLAGVGLGAATNSIICFNFLYSMSTALLTLSARAFGIGDLHLCGVYLNKSRAVLTTFFIPFIILLSFSKQILIALK